MLPANKIKYSSARDYWVRRLFIVCQVPVILSGTTYIRHTSSCMCVGRAQSPESLTGLDLKK
ncbi:hypothetical protein B4916_00870 [Yersinia intermedia]|nr:hypothetical protein B4916_00870 [Yersinia intermedia]